MAQMGGYRCGGFQEKSKPEEPKEKKDKRAPLKNDLNDMAMWDTIVRECTCPECGEVKAMITGPTTNLAINVKCGKCDQKYWLSPVRVFGAR